MHYLVVAEKADTNYSAYAPDVPECVAMGDTVEETIERIRKALQMHLEAIIRDHESLPRPYSVLAVNVEAPEAAFV
ncbi:MAG: type II toxin-antitoxin system HicB family antitoxin [Chloroflexota bacterium]|nr:type II toxin-antitoxin system HicB family antitoxin [Chloroflexota bacterium]